MNTESGKSHNCEIHSEMTVLEIVHSYKKTENVFRKYDKKAGTCICCNALFETLEKVTEKYKLDMKELIRDLEAEINRGTMDRN
jgi:pyrrolidone-carboxylate peptidase